MWLLDAVDRIPVELKEPLDLEEAKIMDKVGTQVLVEMAAVQVTTAGIKAAGTVRQNRPERIQALRHQIIHLNQERNKSLILRKHLKKEKAQEKAINLPDLPASQEVAEEGIRIK
jgi:hypothetical protein